MSNYMEVMVEDLLPSILAEFDEVCKCPRCVADIKALTLNHLKPCYVVGDKGYVYTKIRQLETQAIADIIRQILKAVAVVSSHPRHDES